jgi:site-specific DNA recombinase
MTAEEIGHIVGALGGIARILRRAEPADKAHIYREAGLRLSYEPGLRVIKAQASPGGSCTSLCPRGDLNPHAR